MTTNNSNQQDIDLVQFSTDSKRVFSVDISGLFTKNGKGGNTQSFDVDIPNPYCGKIEEKCKRDCEEKTRGCEEKARECKDEIEECKGEKEEIKQDLKECKDEKKQIKEDCKKDCEDKIKKIKDNLQECKDEKRQIKDDCNVEKKQIKEDCKKDCEDKIKEIKGNLQECKDEQKKIKENCKKDYEDKIKEIKGNLQECKDEQKKIKEDCKKDCDAEKQTIKDDCNAEKESIKQDCKKDCDAEKQTIKDDCNAEKEQIKEDCKNEYEEKIKEIREDCKNEYEEKIKEIKKDCSVDKKEFACRPDCEIFKTHRDDINNLVVKSVKTGETVGGVNISTFFFADGNLYYDTPLDRPTQGPVRDNAYYLKVLPCDAKKQCYRLALCDGDGNISTHAQSGAIIHISKCNLIGGQSIELENYFRKDCLPSFIIKKAPEEKFEGIYYRAEVYEYDPISHEVGDRIGKLNIASITTLQNSRHLDYLSVHDFLSGDLRFSRAIGKTTIVKKEDDLYKMSDPLKYLNGESVDSQTTKFLLDEILCLCDRNVLEDGVQIIG